MKKVFSILCAALIASAAWAETTITFVDGTDNGTEQMTMTKEGITITTTNGYVDGTYARYRFYKGSTTTVTSTVGNITKIVFNCNASGTTKQGPGCWDVDDSNGTYTYSDKVGTWVGDAASVSFTASSNQVQCSSIEVTVGGEAAAVEAPEFSPAGGTVFTGTQEITISCATEGATIWYSMDGETYNEYTGAFTIDAYSIIYAYATLNNDTSLTVSAKYIKRSEVSTVAEANALYNGYNFVFNGNAVVAYQSGKYLWIRDESGSGMIYGTQSATFGNGDVLETGWVGQKTTYNGVVEYQNTEDVEAIGETAECLPFDRDVETIMADTTKAYVNEYFKLSGIKLFAETDTTVKNYAKKFYVVNAAGDSLIFYNQFGIELPEFDADKTYDVIGVMTLYYGEYEVYPISVTETASETHIDGDVNHDGEANVSDVTKLIERVLADKSIDSEDDRCCEICSDVNKDGEINMSDATSLIDIILNNK